MIFGIGTDIIEVSRIEKELSASKDLIENLFTEIEINYCESKRHKFQHYAARFAAKEAFFKALGTGWRYGMKYQEIEIENDELGKPEIKTSGEVKRFLDEKKIEKVNLSVSHLKELAVAVVIMENTLRLRSGE